MQHRSSVPISMVLVWNSSARMFHFTLPGSIVKIPSRIKIRIFSPPFLRSSSRESVCRRVLREWNFLMKCEKGKSRGNYYTRRRRSPIYAVFAASLLGNVNSRVREKAVYRPRCVRQFDFFLYYFASVYLFPLFLSSASSLALLNVRFPSISL